MKTYKFFFQLIKRKHTHSLVALFILNYVCLNICLIEKLFADECN